MRNVLLTAVLCCVVTVWTVTAAHAHCTSIRNVNHYNKLSCGLEQQQTEPQYWWQPRFPRQCQVDIRCDSYARYRTMDGSCNNLKRPQWGKSDWPFDRLLKAQYEDGYWFPRTKSKYGRALPNVRIVSSQGLPPDRDTRELPDIANLFQTWGQFLDHDMTRTPMIQGDYGKNLNCCSVFVNPIDPDRYQGGPCFPIYIPRYDRSFRRPCMAFSRSETAERWKTCKKYHLEQINMVTSFIDGSQIYGSSMAEHEGLRTYSGGQMVMNNHDLPPEETETPNTCFKMTASDYCFRAGDPRVNEHPGLSMLHTVFLREHNRIATELSLINPHWKDERLFQETRKIVGAEMQVITYWEWLPILLGPELMKFFELDLTIPYQYNPETNPTVFNAFPTAAFRYGHSQIPNIWTVGNEKVPLSSMFMRPFFMLSDGFNGISGILKGLVSDHAMKVDSEFSQSISDHLFEHETNPPLDLIALNLQRGRDHGLPSYTDFSSFCSRLTGSKPELPINVYKKFVRLYGSIENVDLFSGGVSERHVPGAQIGPTFAAIIGLHFHKLKYGDRFWHQTGDRRIGFSEAQFREISKARLGRIFCDCSHLEGFQRNVFYLPSKRNPLMDCRKAPSIDLTKWAEQY